MNCKGRSDASAIGAKALVEKWRNIASWAKTIPANGALKPAEIAAATPPPIMTSVVIRSFKRLLYRHLKWLQSEPTARIDLQMPHQLPKRMQRVCSQYLFSRLVHYRSYVQHKLYQPVLPICLF